jgi:acetyl esterase
MQDGARAVQFLRLHAGEYNLNPKPFGATGGSAGAGISLWIGFHNDMADPQSNDPLNLPAV